MMGAGADAAGSGQGPSGSRRSSGKRSATSNNSALSLRGAYTALGVDPSDDKATVKRAYRRLMSQHHPDKLVSKGLPEEMIKLATDKTQHIQKAYEKIKESKGW